MFELIVIALIVTTAVAVLGLLSLADAASERAAMRSRNAVAEAERRDARLFAKVDAAFRRTAVGGRLAAHLSGGGVTMSPLSFIALNILAFVGAYLPLDAVLPQWLAIPGGIFAGYACWWFVERKRRIRRERFIAQLPEIARVISNGSQAGLSLVSALELAQNDIQAPAGEELRRVAQQMRLGQTLEGALEDLRRRMPSRDVGVLISTLVIQQRAGGDLVEALQDLATTLEARREVTREVKTMIVGATFTSYVIPFLVLGLLLLLNTINPGSLDTMVGTLTGRLVLAVAAVVSALGFLMIRRITRIEL